MNDYHIEFSERAERKENEHESRKSDRFVRFEAGPRRSVRPPMAELSRELTETYEVGSEVPRIAVAWRLGRALTETNELDVRKHGGERRRADASLRSISKLLQ